MTELKRLKNDTEQIAAMQEVVASLTQNKLEDAVKIESLEKQVASQECLVKSLQTATTDHVSIENESLKRQICRLTSENEELLNTMQEMDSTRINSKLMSNDLMDKNSATIKKLIQENSDLKTSLKSRDDQTPVDQIRIKYDKCIKKLKLYREKISELREDRDSLRKICTEYSTEVSSWTKDITSASFRMLEKIKTLSEELRQRNDRIEVLEKEVAKPADADDKEELKKVQEEVENLKEQLKSKDRLLAEEREAQKKLKNAVKKTSVLDLEIEAYEKTLDDLNKKLEAKKLEFKELQTTVEVQSNTMESLKNQIVLLEANLESEKNHSAAQREDLDAQLQLSRTTEHQRTEAFLQLELITKNYESLKLEIDEVKTQNAEMVGELEKRNQATESEKNMLSQTVSALEHEVDKFKSLTSRQEKDIESLKSDFVLYKVRAQGVLRQNQTKAKLDEDQELREENLMLQESVESLKKNISKLETDVGVYQKLQADLQDDKNRLQRNMNDMLATLEKQSEEAIEESRLKSQKHEDSIKAYQLQIDTLNAFYKNKIQEDHAKTTATVAELKAYIQKLEAASSRVPVLNEFQRQLKQEEDNIAVMLADREEAEGSEDQSSLSSVFHPQVRRKISKGREMMPLDELLNSSFDDNPSDVNLETMSNFSSPSDELEQTKLKLAREGNRVAHLTALLADSEKDLAKFQQMNDMLKEEVRRQQRNFDREEHLKNSEYLKNIVIKFVSSHSGDEKLRLIPGMHFSLSFYNWFSVFFLLVLVLNTILSLSSEENAMLTSSCKTGWAGLWKK